MPLVFTRTMAAEIDSPTDLWRFSLRLTEKRAGSSRSVIAAARSTRSSSSGRSGRDGSGGKTLGPLRREAGSGPDCSGPDAETEAGGGRRRAGVRMITSIIPGQSGLIPYWNYTILQMKTVLLMPLSIPEVKLMPLSVPEVKLMPLSILEVKLMPLSIPEVELMSP